MTAIVDEAIAAHEAAVISDRRRTITSVRREKQVLQDLSETYGQRFGGLLTKRLATILGCDVEQLEQVSWTLVAWAPSYGDDASLGVDTTQGMRFHADVDDVPVAVVLDQANSTLPSCEFHVEGDGDGGPIHDLASFGREAKRWQSLPKQPQGTKERLVLEISLDSEQVTNIISADRSLIVGRTSTTWHGSSNEMERTIANPSELAGALAELMATGEPVRAQLADGQWRVWPTSALPQAQIRRKALGPWQAPVSAQA